MGWHQRDLVAEAVFFLHGDEITRSMRYDDFREHLLSGRPLGAFESETVRGVYVAIGRDRVIRAACCFALALDQRGAAAADWNVPVRELAHNSGAGPDLGHGAIRFACRAQCSIPWHVTRLWAMSVNEALPALLASQYLVSQVDFADAATRPMQRSVRAPERKDMARTAELPAVSVARAAQRFDAAFGGAQPRVAPDQLNASRSTSEALNTLRRAHAAEIDRLKAAHVRQTASLRAEIKRLRQMLSAESRS